jgi:hypothetical protein
MGCLLSPAFLSENIIFKICFFVFVITWELYSSGKVVLPALRACRGLNFIFY